MRIIATNVLTKPHKSRQLAQEATREKTFLLFLVLTVSLASIHIIARSPDPISVTVPSPSPCSYKIDNRTYNDDKELTGYWIICSGNVQGLIRYDRIFKEYLPSADRTKELT